MTPLGDHALRHLTQTLDTPAAGERYVVHELLGRGGMGSVYRATDVVLGRDVALKVLALPSDTSAYAERLAREAQVLAQLEHPGIVAVHDAGTLEDGRPFYVMRLVRGTSLATLDVREGRGVLLRRFLQVCDAVAFAHARGVLHRDLTPSNVMVGEYGDVLVVDWGVAKLTASAPDEMREASDAGSDAEASRRSSTPVSGGSILPTAAATLDGVVMGTPGFMAPEQARGEARRADVRTDVYGLGAILRDVLARGSMPAPGPLMSIVRCATAVEPAARYQTVEALAEDVRRWLDRERVSAHAEGIWERAAREYDRHRTLVWLLLAYAAVRIAIFVWRGV